MSSHEKVELVFSKSDDGAVRVEARRGEERVGLTREQVVELFGKEEGEGWEKVKGVFVECGALVPLCVPKTQASPVENDCVTDEIESGTKAPHSISFASSNEEKVALFFSLFRGREDVYARRWEGRDGQKSGYSPVCRNEWVPGVCGKPKARCAECKARVCVAFDKQVVSRHLAGKEVAGVYPMLADETCWFLAIDFDGEGWWKEVAAVRSVCERKRFRPQWSGRVRATARMCGFFSTRRFPRFWRGGWGRRF